MPNPNRRAPVGKVTAMKVEFPQIGEMTIGIAQVDLNLAPVGSELFVTPSDKRLMLELEVANENAAHHQQQCVKRGDALHVYRKLLRKLAQPASGLAPDLVAEINRTLDTQ